MNRIIEKIKEYKYIILGFFIGYTLPLVTIIVPLLMHYSLRISFFRVHDFIVSFNYAYLFSPVLSVIPGIFWAFLINLFFKGDSPRYNPKITLFICGVIYVLLFLFYSGILTGKLI